MSRTENYGSLVDAFKHHATDTGSLEVQVVKLTEDIERLNKHYATHAKDHSSKRRILIMVSRRRRYLDYVKDKSQDTYKELIQRLELRK